MGPSFKPENIAVILVEPSHPGNVGAVARAMVNMGVNDLRIVGNCDCEDRDAIKFASNAQHLLKDARHFSNFPEAIKDIQIVVGTSARQRKKLHVSTSSHEISNQLFPIPEHVRIAIVFGRERTGLTNEEMSCCNEWIFIPTYGESNSLNLAQAVIVILYELSKNYGISHNVVLSEPNPASSESLEGLKQHLFQVLNEVRYIRKGKEGSLWESFSGLLGRAKPDDREVRMLRGFFNKILLTIGAKGPRKIPNKPQ